MTDIGYFIIGSALTDSGKHKEAVIQFQRAVALSTSEWQEAMNRRAYGRSLIRADKYSRGREEMLSACNKMKDLGQKKIIDIEESTREIAETMKRLIYANILENFSDTMREDLKNYDRAVLEIIDPRAKEQFMQAGISLKLAGDDVIARNTRAQQRTSPSVSVI